MALFLVLCIPIYSQNQQGVETLRYFDWFKNRHITVRAMRMGWMMMYQTISEPGTRNARSLIYTSTKLTDPNDQWSNWELNNTLSVQYADLSSLNGVYVEDLSQWRREPNTGVEIVMPVWNV
jgi:hypothetical protein